MRRVALILALVVILPAAFVLAGAGDTKGHYLVRAIFDSAAFVVPGEDVKIAGVRVGKIDDVQLTDDNRAAVVIDITEPGFQDFRTDATCKIKPQSLIGEQFVECSPTQKRTSGEAPPELPVIDSGDGEGERLLPVENTSISVGLDLIGDSLRLPQRQKLTLIINELGIGLAGRGRDLNAVIRRSAPALQELDKVLELIATQNRTLERLAVDSDTILEPLARERSHISGFIDSSAKVARATAERRAALEATFQRFPRFLDELRPTMARLGALADEMTPVVADLRDAAPDLDNLLREMGPFSRASIPALEGLGATAEPGIPAIRGAIPIVKDLRTLSTELSPTADTLAEVLVSFQKNEGLERFLDYVFYQAMAVNGFDSVSHFLRAGLIINTCSSYAVTPVDSCSANFVQPSPSQASSADSAKVSLASVGFDEILHRTALVLRGADPADVLAGAERKAKRKSRRGAAADAPIATAPSAQAPPGTAGGAQAPVTGPAEPEPTAGPNTTTQLLDYLFGGDE